MTLAALARSVYASPFHLARMFRERSAFSIHGYRTQLRLRLVLDGLHEGREIGDLALELGFSSHRHFTSTFRGGFRPAAVGRALGRPPRRARIAHVRGSVPRRGFLASNA